MIRRICVRAIIVHNGKLLVVRNKNKEGVPLNHLNLVGGRLEFGEDLVAGLEREVLEELNVKATVGDLLFVQQFQETVKDEDRDYLEFFFNITNVEDFTNSNFAEASHGLLELAEVKFVDPRADTSILPSFLQEVDLEASVKSGKTMFFGHNS